MEMGTVLSVVLILLVIAGIWLVVEVAVTIRRARPVMDRVEKTVEDVAPVIAHVDELVEQAKPVVAHLDEVVEGARPGTQQISPVLEQTTEAIGALTGGLQRLDTILGDVSRISKSAGNATVAVGDAAGSLATKARSLFARGRAGAHAAVPAAGETATAPSAPTYEAVGEDAAPVYADAGYFTYPAPGAPGAEDATEAPSDGAAAQPAESTAR